MLDVAYWVAVVLTGCLLEMFLNGSKPATPVFTPKQLMGFVIFVVIDAITISTCVLEGAVVPRGIWAIVIAFVGIELIISDLKSLGVITYGASAQAMRTEFQRSTRFQQVRSFGITASYAAGALLAWYYGII